MMNNNQRNSTRRALWALPLLMFCLLSVSVQAQTAERQTVSGTVVDAEGETLMGVSVVLKGTTVGTSTDRNGGFTFPRPLLSDDILQFSSIGFKTQEVKVSNIGAADWELVMEEDIIIAGVEVVRGNYSYNCYATSRGLRGWWQRLTNR